MKIEDHVENSRKALDLGQERILSEDYESAMTLFAAAYAETRALMDHAWRLKRDAMLADRPPGENVQ